jgi:hypothetical protein
MDHKFYDYPHKEIAHAMFRKKTTNVVLNMVLVVTTYIEKCGIQGIFFSKE